MEAVDIEVATDLARFLAAIFPPLIAGDILPDFLAKTFRFGLLFSFSDDRGRGIGFSFLFPFIESLVFSRLDQDGKLVLVSSHY